MIMRNTEEEKKIVIASTKTETEKMINKNKNKTNKPASKQAKDEVLSKSKSDEWKNLAISFDFETFSFSIHSCN